MTSGEQVSAEVAAAETRVKQAQVELLAAQQGNGDVAKAELNVKQAEVELLAARERQQQSRT